MYYSLVTGANRGIGLEIARQLSQRGHHVLMGVRDPKAAEAALRQVAATGGKATLIPLDLTYPDSLALAVSQVKMLTPRLDVLINNAAILLPESQQLLKAPMSEIEETLQVNVLGALRMVRHFRPLLKAGSRIINVSSEAGAICGGAGTYAPVYSLSKTALNALTMHLAHTLAGEEISVNAVCPGWVRTRMGGQGAPRSAAEGADTPVWLATETDPALTGRFWQDRREIGW
ncbi:MAG: SDR family NAD(P)-dependent oxidoreductase [Bacteroidetes bacterium]|nr:MAG: SDR family NAD(P)-dependent oxidoreductase [Bacteroidota bacterium]